METRFFKVTSYVEVFVPPETSLKEGKELALQRVEDGDDVFRENISVDEDMRTDDFEFMTDSFRLAVAIFEEFDVEACRKWYEKARFNVEVCDDA